MQPALNPSPISEADYLNGEKSAKKRHEYVAGSIYAMAGASLRHNDIALNIAFALRAAAKGTPCRVNVSDVKVHIERSRAYYYPDVVVGCKSESDQQHFIEQPCLLVEVTSASTEWKDYAEKALAYQQIPSLKAYLIVTQAFRQVTVYYRDAQQQWQVTRFNELSQSIELECPQGVLSLADIYAGINFDK